MKRPYWLYRKPLFIIIFGTDTPAGKAFDVGVIIVIAVSLLVGVVESIHGLPLLLRQILAVAEYLITALFTLEYAARIWCHPNPRRYVFSFFGIIDLLSTLPLYLTLLFPASRYIVLLRTFRLIRVFRIFRMFNFLNEGYLLMESIRRSWNKIFVFFLFVVILVICTGTLMFMIEGNRPGTPFTDLGTSIYWAIVTMSTVGYGDIAPVTPLGRLLSSVVMLLGYTIIAVPTGIISASVIDTTRKRVRHGRCPRCNHTVRKGDRFCAYCGEKL